MVGKSDMLDDSQRGFVCADTGLALVKGAPTAGFTPIAPPPLQQHPAYALTMQALGSDVGFWRIQRPGGDLLATLLVMQRTVLPFITIKTQLRGPCWIKAPSDTEKRASYKLIQKLGRPWRWQFMVQSPDEVDTPPMRAVLRSIGLRRVMGGFHTGHVDLSGTKADIRARLKGKWRNQLKKAEAAGLKLSITENLDAATTRWVIDHETAQRKDRGYHALPPAFLDHWALHGRSLCVVAMQGREKIAGALILIHGTGATYHLGVSSDAGRAVNAQNLVLFNAMLALKERGVCLMDLGGIDSGPLKNISHFKLGTGAKPVSLIGSFSK